MKSALVIAGVTTALVGVALVNSTPDFLTFIVKATIAILLLLIFLIPVRRRLSKGSDVVSKKTTAAIGGGLGIGAVLSQELLLRLIS